LDPTVGTSQSREAKGKAAVVHHPIVETIPNLQVPHQVAIDPEILEKLDPDQTDDNLRKYFLYYRKEPIGPQKGKQMAKCRVCDEIYIRTDGSTTSIIKHLRTHTQLWNIYDKAKKQIELKKQQKKTLDGTGYKF
jgi:hypothetical protein